MSKSIVKACVRYRDRLYTGFDHGECFKKLNEDNTILVHSEIEQGFVDSDGNFVDRKHAMLIAKEAGQLTYENDKKTLISEDLHLNWLNKQAERIAELEEQLKNAIVPKFKIGQEVWFISMTNYVCNFIIQELQYTLCCDGRSGICYFSKDNLEEYEWNLFATKEQAEQRLKELKGEN